MEGDVKYVPISLDTPESDKPAVSLPAEEKKIEKEK
jgi:hypothetical protein